MRGKSSFTVFDTDRGISHVKENSHLETDIWDAQINATTTVFRQSFIAHMTHG